LSYPIQLDEYSDDKIFEESRRRKTCKAQHLCHYCGKRLDSCVGKPLTRESGCKLSAHNEPVPAAVAQEVLLQGLAEMITQELPSARGFALVVAPTVEGSERHGDITSYVASIRAEDVPKLMRDTADYIDAREAAKRT